MGLAVSIGLLAAIFYMASREPDAPGPPAPRRGGRITASVPALTADILLPLTQAALVRVNPATFELEPWLAEKWESSADGHVHTLHLRPDVRWSDGTDFTSADVLATLTAAGLRALGQPVRVSVTDARTVALAFAAPFGPGLRILDGLAIRQKDGKNVGLGPFIVREQDAQRAVLDRNPRYWRNGADGDPLPYLDRVVLEVVADADAELKRLAAGEIDLPGGALRPRDFVTARRAEENGRLQLIEVGVAPAADAFWFCLSPAVRGQDPRFAFISQPEFRKAISHALDREAFAEQVFLGSAVPIWGPITPGNERWFSPDLPRYFHDDERVRMMLAGIGLEDRNKNGVVEDAAGTEARFTVITQQGAESYDRGLRILRDELARIGIAIDAEPLDAASIALRIAACDYDAMYYQPPVRDLDPAENLDFWLTSGAEHYWSPAQKTPATDWERRIDTLMLEQAGSIDENRRRQQFDLVQQIFAENLPMLYFAAPRIYVAHSPRLQGIVPSVLHPHVLWNAERLFVSP